MVKKKSTYKKGHKKTKSRGKSVKPMRKRQEIKRKQIKKRAFIRKMKYITILLTFGIIAASAIIFYLSFSDEDKTDNNGSPANHSNGNNGSNIGTEVGQTAPDFELIDVEGNGFSLEGYHGDVVILDFMTTWCGSCEGEMEHLKEVRSSYDNSIVRIISIDVDDTESSEKLRDFKYNHSCDWIFASNGGGVGNTYEVLNIPMLYIVDQQGTITYRNVGLTDSATLSSEIDKIL